MYHPTEQLSIPFNKLPYHSDEMMANHQPHQHNPISNSFKSQVPMRPSPIVHPAVDAPICPECQALDSTFFNPECKACQNELETMAHHGIGIASIFAILRQWIPQVCMHSN